MVEKRDLILVLLRDVDIDHKLSFLLNFLRSKTYHDDFDVIICSPGFTQPITKTRSLFFRANGHRRAFIPDLFEVQGRYETLH